MLAPGQSDRDDGIGGAVLLLAGRGDALLLDLAHFSRQMLCF